VECSPSNQTSPCGHHEGRPPSCQKSSNALGKIVKQAPNWGQAINEQATPMCKFITNHLSCANPSWNIWGANIHHVPQISWTQTWCQHFQSNSKANKTKTMQRGCIPTPMDPIWIQHKFWDPMCDCCKFGCTRVLYMAWLTNLEAWVVATTFSLPLQITCKHYSWDWRNFNKWFSTMYR